MATGTNETEKDKGSEEPPDAKVAEGDEQSSVTSTPKSTDTDDVSASKFVEFTDRITALSLEKIGALVFLICGLGIISILLLSLYIDEIKNYEALRSAEILLILAGTALVVALIARTRYTAIIVLGFLFIGSLIVPINDLIRLTLIVVGSDQKFQDFFVESSTGKSQITRNFEVASKVYARLEAEGVVAPTTANHVRMAAIWGISAALDEAQRVELVHKVQQRGVFRLLRMLSDDIKRTEWIYRFGNDGKFRNDLSFLRSEGLVSYLYDDLDTIEIQPLGWDVLGSPGSAPVISYPGGPLSAGVEAGPSLSEPSPDAVAALNIVDDYQSTDLAKIDGVEIGSDYSWFSMKVEETDRYVIDVLAQVSLVDPYVVLLRSLDPDDIITFDDDGGENFNSQIDIELDPGTYYLAIRDLASIHGQVKVVIGRLSGSAAMQLQ